jgi:hypothetical protein
VNAIERARPSRETIGIRSRTHGRFGTPEYRVWAAMKRRCCNPNVWNFHRYGGRGIRMCDEWRDSFAAFYAHIGQRPSAQHSVDRIDNNGNYEPGNVRWATRQQQRANQRKRQR